MTASDSADPPYVSVSPVGFHITALLSFMQSPNRVSVSETQERRDWATASTVNRLQRAFPRTPAATNSFNLLVYNKSRDSDRICPGCRRWYKFGESEHHYASFNDFIRRDPPIWEVMPPGQLEEQELSGICSQHCMNALTEDAEDAERTSGKELLRSGQWVMRRTTTAEEAEAGVKIVWERIDGN